MFERSRSVQHPQLGELTRSRRAWRGSVTLTDGPSIRLSIIGERSEPDPEAVALAANIAAEFGAQRQRIEAVLREHAADLGIHPTELPAPSYAAVIAIDGTPVIEFGYYVAWDDDHTLGVTLRDGEVELNGSVLEP